MPRRTTLDSSLTTGARLAGRFELVAPVADAGITEAWSARDAHGAEHRVSVLGPQSPALQSLLSPTLERVRGLSNPGLVTTTELAAADGMIFTASEPFDGRPLSNWIEGHRQADTRPGFGVVQRLFDRLAAALQAAHSAGVVHGALSPRCVLLKRVGQGPHHLRVCDFALGPFTVQSGTTPSWFEYQAPEQRGPRVEDAPAVDVFSAAAVLVEMLTLSSGPRVDAREPWGPFVRDAKGNAVVERLVALRSEVPRAVWEVIAGALSPNPRERGTIQKLQRSLRETWTTVGEWDRSAFAEPDPPPPDPSRVGARVSLAGAYTKPRGAEGIEGWQSAERAAVAVTPSRPQVRPAPPPQPPPQASPAIAVTAPPRQVLAQTRPAELTHPSPASEPSEATEAIDLNAAELYLQNLHAAAPRRTEPRAAPVVEEREHTKAIDASAFFDEPAGAAGGLDDSAGTAVISQAGGIAAAVAAAAAAPDESTRMLDYAPPPQPSQTPWSAGAESAPNLYAHQGSTNFGSEDPFADSRSSIPGYSPQTEAWAAPLPSSPPVASPFTATLKSVPRDSLPSPMQPVGPSAPTAERLWGAAPPPAPPAALPDPEPKVPVWQWAVLLAAIVGVGAAMYLALTGR